MFCLADALKCVPRWSAEKSSKANETDVELCKLIYISSHEVNPRYRCGRPLNGSVVTERKTDTS